jgi:hypothetical protein
LQSQVGDAIVRESHGRLGRGAAAALVVVLASLARTLSFIGKRVRYLPLVAPDTSKHCKLSIEFTVLVARSSAACVRIVPAPCTSRSCRPEDVRKGMTKCPGDGNGAHCDRARREGDPDSCTLALNGSSVPVPRQGAWPIPKPGWNLHEGAHAWGRGHPARPRLRVRAASKPAGSVVA